MGRGHKKKLLLLGVWRLGVASINSWHRVCKICINKSTYDMYNINGILTIS